MARPAKLNAEWFTHAAGLRNDRRVKAIRTATGAAGYGIFHMILEALTDADYTQLLVDDMELELLAGDFGVSVTEIHSLLQIGVKVGYFVIDQAHLLTCPDLNKWLEMHFEKRNRSRNAGKSGSLSQPVTGTGVSVTEIPHNTLQNNTIQHSTETPPTPGVGVLAVGSKKNEGPAPVEELPAEGSTASASHTGPAAPAADSRPEFRPDPEWAAQMRQVAEQLIAFYQLSQQQQQARIALTRFCRVLFEQGQGPLLESQFTAYRAYKKLRDERVHGWKSYLGTEAQAYVDGAWNEKDWVSALAEARKPHQTGTSHGNITAGGLTSRNRYNTPPRRDFSNDRRSGTGTNGGAAAA